MVYYNQMMMQVKERQLKKFWSKKNLPQSDAIAEAFIAADFQVRSTNMDVTAGHILKSAKHL